MVVYLTELYYGGEAFTADQPQSFTCPYCGKMGFTESALQEHVASEHSDASNEVVSYYCAYFCLKVQICFSKVVICKY